MNKKILFTLMLAVMPASQSLQASNEGCGCFDMVSLLWNKITNKQKKQYSNYNIQKNDLIVSGGYAGYSSSEYDKGTSKVKPKNTPIDRSYVMLSN